MPRSFAEKYTQFQIDEGISILPENIKLCKYFIKKCLYYITSWTFVIANFDRIKFLSKEIMIKGWSPAKKDGPSSSKKKSSSSPSPSKSELKKRLEKVLSELEDEPDEEAINRLLDEASSQSDDNCEMLKPKALARSYLNPFD
ncbi:hypothetical protein EJD97_010641 [Solanum chilense]|uniref:Uncharacterized protein n=1 Tax=Solanum chilense TaxID=4083 RepID=A0A6N2BNE1_SOLCI|nr:hypothetical protein EJD97_010641 [Solanum chilense]